MTLQSLQSLQRQRQRFRFRFRLRSSDLQSDSDLDSIRNSCDVWDITYKPSKLNTFWKCFVCLTASLALVALCLATSAKLKNLDEHINIVVEATKSSVVKEEQALNVEC